MEVYNQINHEMKPVRIRYLHEINNMTPKKESSKLPYKPHIKRSVGEYYPTLEDRIKA